MASFDLSVIIVSWNVRDLLRQCLSSIDQSLKRKNLSSEIIMVDNSSADGTPGMVREQFPEVVVVENQENIGFSKANNLGIKSSRGRYLLLLNPDTEVIDDALGRMVGYMETNPQVGALGPRLLDSQMEIISSRRRFPTLATAFMESTTLESWFPNHPLIRRYRRADQPEDQVQEVDWVVGAAILLRRAALERVGFLDEDFFMYSEELDLCYRLRRSGWKVIYFPLAQIVHHEGKSSEQAEAFKHRQFQRSKILFFRKHHSLWAAETLRLFLLFHYLYQLLLEGIKGLLGHKRSMRFQRVGVYWQVIRSGLR
ncbi:MAG: glycosyltransferase family 2 protein [Chloroflexi bacterium]|nr:glycosyltransferase family 2 protein [Chloroflexota bacterium]